VFRRQLLQSNRPETSFLIYADTLVRRPRVATALPEIRTPNIDWPRLAKGQKKKKKKKKLLFLTEPTRPPRLSRRRVTRCAPANIPSAKGTGILASRRRTDHRTGRVTLSVRTVQWSWYFLTRVVGYRALSGSGVRHPALKLPRLAGAARIGLNLLVTLYLSDGW